jgi:hypothetical protein
MFFPIFVKEYGLTITSHPGIADSTVMTILVAPWFVATLFLLLLGWVRCRHVAAIAFALMRWTKHEIYEHSHRYKNKIWPKKLRRYMTDWKLLEEHDKPTVRKNTITLK